MISNGLFFCPVCGKQSAIWQDDCDADDLGYLTPGIVHLYTCSECGSEIEAFEPIERTTE